MDSYGFTGWPRCRGWGSGGAPGPGCSRTQLGPHGSCDRSRRRVCALPAEKLCLKKQLESCRWGQGFTFAQQHCWAESWPWTGRFGRLCPYHAGRGSGCPPDRRGNWGAKSRTFPGVETHREAPPCRGLFLQGRALRAGRGHTQGSACRTASRGLAWLGCSSTETWGLCHTLPWGPCHAL